MSSKATFAATSLLAFLSYSQANGSCGSEGFGERGAGPQPVAFTFFGQRSEGIKENAELAKEMAEMILNNAGVMHPLPTVEIFADEASFQKYRRDWINLSAEQGSRADDVNFAWLIHTISMIEFLATEATVEQMTLWRQNPHNVPLNVLFSRAREQTELRTGYVWPRLARKQMMNLRAAVKRVKAMLRSEEMQSYPMSNIFLQLAVNDFDKRFEYLLDFDEFDGTMHGIAAEHALPYWQLLIWHAQCVEDLLPILARQASQP